MKQTYTWKLEPVAGEDVEQLCDRIAGPAQFILTMNRWVSNVQVEIYDDHVLLMLTMTGHDRWWIRKRSPYLISAVIIRGKLDKTKVQHIDVATEPTLKNARYRTEDGKRVTEPPEGVEPREVIWTCKTCQEDRDPKHWFFGSGWYSGDEIVDVDLRRRSHRPIAPQDR